MVEAQLGSFILQSLLTKDSLHEQYSNIYIFLVAILVIAFILTYITIVNNGYSQEDAGSVSTARRSSLLLMNLVHFLKWYAFRTPWLLASAFSFKLWLDHHDQQHSSEIYAEMVVLSYP
eukprot:TRINITY_DN8982_c0_g1_i1.p3 TRINITY_DN8982_c0_g1~~TRINITY_DN8982_c0_g1_i1.p3  ORF type:complete len:119 (+),score=10.62 TRINITY_DN8982_c0_g1_i1:549-905(+)